MTVVTLRTCHALIGVVTLVQFTIPLGAFAQGTENVSLQFKWPSPVSLQVERSFERFERLPDSPEAPSASSITRFVWRGTESGGRYKIAFSDFEVVRPEPEPPSKDTLVQLEHISRSVEPLLPTIVVDDAGQPVDLEGLQALRDHMMPFYRAIPGLHQDMQAQRMADVLTSDRFLAQRALEDWNRMVQVWHGVNAEIGAIKEIAGDTGAAVGNPVRNVFTYSVERRLPCEDADSQVSCVRLVIKQVPRFNDVRAASLTLLGFDFVTVLGAPPTARLEVENTFITDTHPETLLPVHYKKEKRWSVTWNAESGQQRVVSRTDRWEYHFTPEIDGRSPPATR